MTKFVNFGFLFLTSCSLLAPDSDYFSGEYNKNVKPDSSVEDTNQVINKPDVVVVNPDVVSEVNNKPEVGAVNEVSVVVPDAVVDPGTVDVSIDAADVEAEVVDPLAKLGRGGPYRFNIVEETERWMGIDPCVISHDPVVGNQKPGSLKYAFPMQSDGTATRCELDLYIGPPYEDFPTYEVKMYVKTNAPVGAVIKPFIKRGRGYAWADNGSTQVNDGWTLLTMDLDAPPFHSDQISAIGIEISIAPIGVNEEVVSYDVWVDDFTFTPK
jgi:hypothetical protein